ncbi:MAG: c-type cytochrome [Comamonadaceae bacterium]|nr:c-type cytochrome [Comamonadaceae bacterium]
MMISLATLVAAASFSSGAMALDGAKLYAEKTCNACHGPQGNKALMPDYPKIAGQNKAYLAEADEGHQERCPRQRQQRRHEGRHAPGVRCRDRRHRRLRLEAETLTPAGLKPAPMLDLGRRGA